MSDQPRDWDKEMAEIDKAIARMPAAPPRGAQAAPAPGRAGAGSAPVVATPAMPAVRRRDRAATWLWLVIALGLAVVTPLWPYPAACGLGLIYYLGALAALVIASVLSLRASWRARQGRANGIAVLLLLWGLGLVAYAVLPRIGYAREAATWRCPANPAPLPSAAPGGATSAPQGG